MKQRMKKLLAMGLSAVMLTSLAVPAMAAEDGVITITNDKDRTIQFVDTGITELMTDEVEFYKKAIQSNDIFKNWVSLAYNIFESESKSSCDSDGEIWGQNWDELYGKEIGFMDYMLTSKQGVCGKYDNMRPTSTGLTVATSLAEVQYRAANAIAAEFDDSILNPFTTADILDRHDMSKALTDETQLVLYSTLFVPFELLPNGMSDEPEAYDSFTIAFYDFQLHVLDDGEELDAERTVTSSTKNNLFYVHTINNSLVDAGQDILLDFSVNESLSTSLTNSESYTFGNSMGVSLAYGTKYSDKQQPTEVVGLDSSFGVTKKHSYAEAVETAWTDTVLTSQNATKSSHADCMVPAHTALVGSQSIATTKYTDTYDCPMGISFKVAIFSMCAEIGYDDVRSFVTIIGGGENNEDAVEQLYQRASVAEHYSDINYDKSFAYTRGTYKNGDTWCDGLNWNTIRNLDAPASQNITGLKGGTDLISALDNTYPMSATGGKTTIYQDAFETKLGTAQPLFPIASTYINWQLDEEWSLDRTFDLTVGETFPITSYRVKACDKDGVPYHGFVGTWGTWKIVNSDGIEATSSVAKMENDLVTGSQILTATAPGTIYVKYFIPEKTYYTYDGVASTNANISSPAYKVVVSADPQKLPAVIEVSGTVNATVGKTQNLNQSLTVAAYDATDKKVKITPSWESRELEEDGITVKTNGELTCTKPGTYHVRAYVDDLRSDWVEVIATESPDLILGMSHHPFPDVPYDHWANDAVGFAYQNGIMNGVKADRFDPAGQVTRSQVAQTLYNLAGQPLIVSENPFADVAEDAWYAKAVAWAAENGLTEGKSADRFAPNDPVTREQLVTFICRYADWKGLVLPSKEVDLSQYQDAGQVSGWAKDFVLRALEAGIINGKSEDTLAPQGTATRAQIAQIFMNLLAE